MSKLEYNFDPIETALAAILELTDIKREEILPTLQMLSTIQYDRGRKQEIADRNQTQVVGKCRSYFVSKGEDK